MNNIREKIAQMLIMGFDGTEINATDSVSHWISKDLIGGVVLFDKNVDDESKAKNLVNVDQIRKLNKQLDSISQSHPFPLFKAIDYEGGAVDRLKNIDGCFKTIPASELSNLKKDELHSYFKKMATTLYDLGFNLNFAPVVDLDLHSEKGIIGKFQRSFSGNPDLVSIYANHFIKCFEQLGIACSLKHFPGHGSATGDSHIQAVDVSNEFQMTELFPYQYLIEHSKAPMMIMTAHVINKNLDNSGLPASLSKVMQTELLRRKYNFNGIIISDDMQMSAIKDNFSLKEALCLVLNAGTDMFIFANQMAFNEPAKIIDTIEELILEGLVDINNIHQAYERITHFKRSVFNKTELNVAAY